ncbi:MAG TPA: hypothetical protein VMH39_16285 [Gemmatimonadaceae bacterium]|nr:hypothetical protein [Gemmatimonadaceae bacterium]
MARELIEQVDAVVAEDVRMVRASTEIVFHLSPAYDRPQLRRPSLQVVIVAAGTIEREAKAEDTTDPDLGDGSQDSLGSQ